MKRFLALSTALVVTLALSACSDKKGAGPAPTANAGPDQQVDADAQVTLDGTASTGTELTFLWRQTQGTTVSLSDSTSSTPFFTAPSGTETLVFELTVRDNEMRIATDAVQIQVMGTGLAANAGPNQRVGAGALVTLDGSGSTGENLTYLWRQTAGVAVTLSDSTTATVTFTAPDVTGYVTFELRVASGGATSVDDVLIEIEGTANLPPIANAGADQTVPFGAQVTLNGSGSDPDGDALTYLWTQLAPGPFVTLDDASRAQPKFTAPNAPQAIQFSLTVSATGGNDTDTTIVAVTDPDSIPATTPVLYVVSSQNQSVSGFPDPSTLSGDVAPTVHLGGGSTTFSEPSAVVIDGAGNRIVANANPKVTVHASTANGDVAPVRTVEGDMTLFASPSALAIDRLGDILMVGDGGNGVIFSFDRVSGSFFDGNIYPSRVIIPALPRVPAGMHLAANGELYVSDLNVGEILVWRDATRISGQVAPRRKVTHPAMSQPGGVFVDSANDRLYVASTGNGRVLVWENASLLNGNHAPTQILDVGGAPRAIVVDAANRGYVAMRTTDQVFRIDDIHMKSGPITPDAILAGASTQLAGPTALFLVE